MFSKVQNQINIVTEYADDGDLSQKIEKLRQKKITIYRKRNIELFNSIMFSIKSYT